MRSAGAIFLLTALAAVVAPASLILAVALASAGALGALIQSTTVSKRALSASLLVAVTVGVYTARARGSLLLGAGSALLAGLVAFAVSSRVRSRAEIRLVAAGEMFCYLSLAGVALGHQAVNENREFLTSTTGGERFSFVFASSPSQAAMIAGATLVLAWTTPVPIRPRRRLGLICVSAVLLYGANYRFVIVLTALVLIAWWMTRRTNRARRGLSVLAVGLLVLPVWWPTLSALIDEPTAATISRIPGLGSRNVSQSDIEEARSLNQRTNIWRANLDLIGRSGAPDVLLGYGHEGGDARYDDDVRPIVQGDFVRTDTISSHNTPLEVLRRAGLPMLLLCLVAGGVLIGRVQRWPRSGNYAVAVSLISFGSTDVSVVPLPAMPLFMFLVACLPAVVLSQPRGSFGSLASVADPGIRVGSVERTSTGFRPLTRGSATEGLTSPLISLD